MSLNSEIILCQGIKVDRDYVNVLSYSESDMVALCRSLALQSANDYSFIRNQNSLAVNFSYDNCLKANYIAFQNTDYSNKWFFAWIDDVKYISDSSVEISFTVDSWSTWWDYWRATPSYVLREHVNDDTIGMNTVPENIDIGEPICEHEDTFQLLNYYYIAILTSWIPETGQWDIANPHGKSYASASYISKMFMGKTLLLFSPTAPEDVANYILIANADGHVEDIESIFVIPQSFIGPQMVEYHEVTRYISTPTETDSVSTTFWTVKANEYIYSTTVTLPRITSFSACPVRNNKCFTYPYNYIYISNNNGNSNTYKYEMFDPRTTMDFEFKGIPTIGCSGMLYPIHYRNMTKDIDEAIPMGKFPTFAWVSDTFINWISQQGVNFISNVVSGVGGTLSSGMSSRSGSGAQVSVGLLETLLSALGSFHEANTRPNVTHGQNTGDVLYATDNNTYTFRCMRCKNEIMEQIDDYFSRFGYAINRVKMPNLTGRANFNYIKIADDVGEGNAPSRYMEDINRACKTGVTIWHNHDNLGNFNVANGIL